MITPKIYQKQESQSFQGNTETRKGIHKCARHAIQAHIQEGLGKNIMVDL